MSSESGTTGDKGSGGSGDQGSGGLVLRGGSGSAGRGGSRGSGRGSGSGSGRGSAGSAGSKGTKGSISRDVGSAFLCTFRVAEERFALSTALVRELVEVTNVTRVPQTSQALLGLFNLRGEPLPLVDMAAVLGLPRETSG